MHDQTEAALQTEETVLVGGSSEEEEEEADEPDNDLFSLEQVEDEHEDSDLYDEEFSQELDELQEGSSESETRSRHAEHRSAPSQTRQTDIYRRHYQSDAAERSERMQRRSGTQEDNEVWSGGELGRSSSRRKTICRFWRTTKRSFTSQRTICRMIF